jgi:hypothetical protein
MNIFNFGNKVNKVIRTSILTLVTMATIAIISKFETLVTKAGMITLVNKVVVNVHALCPCVKCVLFPPPPPFKTNLNFLDRLSKIAQYKISQESVQRES